MIKSLERVLHRRTFLHGNGVLFLLHFCSLSHLIEYSRKEQDGLVPWEMHMHGTGVAKEFWYINVSEEGAYSNRCMKQEKGRALLMYLCKIEEEAAYGIY